MPYTSDFNGKKLEINKNKPSKIKQRFMDYSLIERQASEDLEEDKPRQIRVHKPFVL
jgi:hypothetical protein